MNMAIACNVMLAGAVVSLAQDGSAIQGRPLSEWLSDLRGANRGRQVRAARALAEAPPELRPRIVPHVIPVLQSERENDKFAAAQVLGECGPAARAAVPDLLPMLVGTQFERNRAAAAKALGQILKDAQPCEEVEKVAAALARKFNEDYDSYCDVRRECVRAIGMIGPAAKSVIPELAKALTDAGEGTPGDVMVRQEAAWACGRMGPLAAQHVDRLIAMMHGEDWMPETVEALGRIGPVNDSVVPNIVDRLEVAANHGWGRGTHMALWPFGLAAMRALQQFGPKAVAAVPFLMRLLPDRSGSDTVDIRANLEVITEVTRTLGAIGPAARDAIPRLEVMTTFRNHPHGDNTQSKLDALHEAAAKALAAVRSQASR